MQELPWSSVLTCICGDLARYIAASTHYEFRSPYTSRLQWDECYEGDTSTITNRHSRRQKKGGA